MGKVLLQLFIFSLLILHFSPAQVFVQTENVEDEEIQTDYVEMINKWTQIPSYDNFGFGGISKIYLKITDLEF